MADKYFSNDFQQHYTITAMKEQKEKEEMERKVQAMMFEQAEFEKLWNTIEADFRGERVTQNYPGLYYVPFGFAQKFKDRILTEKQIGLNKGISILVSGQNDNLLFIDGPNASYDLTDQISAHQLTQLRANYKENRFKVLMPNIEHAIRTNKKKIEVLRDDNHITKDINDVLRKYGYNVVYKSHCHEHLHSVGRTEYYFDLVKV